MLEVVSHQTHLEQMMKDFIDEAEGWDLEPKPVSPWWTSIYADEKKEDMMIETKKKSPHECPFEKSVKIL